MAGSGVWRALQTLTYRSLAATSGRFPAPAEFLPTPALFSPSPPWRSCPVRGLQRSSALCAGHNKWSKVKHIKGPKDEERGRMMAKFGMMIRIAVKEGGPNPNMNINLAHLLEQCKRKNIPKASIEAAIKGAEKAKPVSQQIFEARGPGGCLLLVEVLTDNVTRSHSEIKHLLHKNGGMLSDGARHNYDRKGVVVVPGQDVTTERALELAIEAGAEDVQETKDEEEQPLLQFFCDVKNTMKVRASLEELGMQITSSGMEFIPRDLLVLDQNQLNAASTLIEALNDFSDVVRVWDNIQADS